MALAAKKASEPERRLVVTRVFDAPREMVFEAFTDRAQVAQWMGSQGVTADIKEIDARPGGAYLFAMTGKESGTVWTVRGAYREVVAPERLVFTWTWDNNTSTETLVTVIFKAVGQKTEVTLTHEDFANVESRDRHNQGWVGSFNALAAFLAKA